MNRSRSAFYAFPREGFRRRLLAVAVVAALPGALQAQSSALPAPQSAPAGKSVLTFPAPPSKNPQGDPRVTKVEADRIDGRDQMHMSAQGHVRLERGDMLLTSDQLYFDQVANEVQAKGSVKLLRGADTIESPEGRVNLDTWFGEFKEPTYNVQRERKVTVDGPSNSPRGLRPIMQMVSGSGQADVLKLEGENHYRLSNSTYTTCPAPNPSWYLRMNDLALDFDRDKGQATHTTLVFKDVPIAYMPWAEFPLNGGRQSGFLPPTLGASNSTGFDTSVPYYFNLAPNYDATFAPRWMSERGLQLAGEARYLGAKGTGIVKGEYLNEDKVTQNSRALYAWKHVQDFGLGFSGNVEATQVSDKTYFADLSSKITATSQSALSQSALLNYNSGTWLSGSLLTQRYQILSGAAPYNRMPKITLNAKQADFHGLSLNLPAEYTNFTHPTQDEGKRLIVYPQVAYTLQNSAFYMTPKVGVNLSHYSIDRTVSTGDSTIVRSIPTVSVDAGAVLERPFSLGKTEHIQTLEPRVYYIRNTYRDQSQIPVFDTGRADFNFAQIFSENLYSGQDRIADANQLTAGVQSRMIESESGEEWLRVAAAQRYYFEDQRVTLPGETQRTGSVANLLGAVSGRVRRDVWMDNAAEYDPRTGLWQRATTGFRYQPDFSKSAAISYRFQRDLFRDLDFSVQWPIWRNVYGVGRYNLNLRDHRLTEAIAGLEYKGDCWVLRGVWQTLLTTAQTNGQSRNNSFFVQLEFNGFASIGSNPVNLLKRSVSGYGKINEPGVGDPMFGDATQP